MTNDALMTGLLVLAYGTPERLDDVKAYLTHIRHGHEPSDDAVENLKDRYRRIGGPSPLYRITVDQMRVLEERLNSWGARFRAYLGMKHWRPYIPDAVRRMAADGIAEAVAVILAPHYSSMSIAQYLESVRRGLDALDQPIRILCVKSYHCEPRFIDALEESVRAGLAKVPANDRGRVPVIFTAHSLPQRILEANDPYRDQLLDTCRLLADRFEGLDWRLAFTSQGSTREKWLGPTLAEAFDELASAGHEAVLAVTVGFVSEHLETLYDFDIEGKRDAEARGLRFYRAPALNTNAAFIDALAALVRKAMSGELRDVVELPAESPEAPTYPTYP